MLENLEESKLVYNEEYEKAVLGAIIQDGSVVKEIIAKIDYEDFYIKRHQIIFKAIFDMSNSGKDIDQLTLIEYLTSKGELEIVGGAGYITALPISTPTIANYKYYVESVETLSFRRKIQKVSYDFYRLSVDKTKDIRSVIEDLGKKITAISSRHIDAEYKTSSIIFNDFLKEIEIRVKQKLTLVGLPTGFSRLNELTNGFKKSEYIIIGARPSIGKTSFALSMMMNLAFVNNKKVGFFSLEMDAKDIMFKIVSGLSKIPHYNLVRGAVKDNEWFKLADVGDKLRSNNLLICDSPNMRLIDLKSLARQMKDNNDIDIIFIDYMSLITTDNPSLPVYERITDVSRNLKALARELQIPIVVLAQLTREAESKDAKGAGSEPILSQLRDSGSIEQDADIVMLLHRARNPHANTEKDRDGVEKEVDENIQDTKIIVAKNRNGMTGDLTVDFIKNVTLFVDKEGEI